MHKTTVQRIRNCSKDLQKLYDKILPKLNKNEQEIILNLIGIRVAKTAINVIELINTEVHTYQEVSEKLGISLNTVKQITYALKENFNISCDGKYLASRTGRPQKNWKRRKDYMDS